MQTQSIQTLIQSFAKENKISKVKLQSFADSILSLQPQHGRPMLSKTKELHNQILEYIRQGKTNSSEIIQASGMDKVTLNNNIRALEKHGMITRTGTISTGKRGRKLVQYSINSAAL